jgi:hypothetical protein
MAVGFNHIDFKPLITEQIMAFFDGMPLEFATPRGYRKIGSRHLYEITTDKEAKNTDVWHPPCPYRSGKDGRL